MSFWSTITGTTDQAEQDANLAHQQQLLEEAVRRRELEGTISIDDAASVREYAAGVRDESTDAAAWEGFQEGAAEGLNNVLDAPGKLIGGIGAGASQILGGILKNVPWWLWIGGGLALFLYLGGGIILRRTILSRL